MKDLNANLMVMDHLNDCIRKDKKSFNKYKFLQTICEAQMVILKNQEEILSNQEEILSKN